VRLGSSLSAGHHHAPRKGDGHGGFNAFCRGLEQPETYAAQLAGVLPALCAEIKMSVKGSANHQPLRLRLRRNIVPVSEPTRAARDFSFGLLRRVKEGSISPTISPAAVSTSLVSVSR
jgi:hypothetical protein